MKTSSWLMPLHASCSLLSEDLSAAAVPWWPHHTHTADWRPYNGPFGWRRFRPIIRCYQWQSNSLEWFIVTRRRRAIVQTTATADALPPPPPPVVRSVAIKRLPSLYAHHSLSDSGCVTLLQPLHTARPVSLSLWITVAHT